MKPRLRWSTLLAILVLALNARLVLALDVPPLRGRVNDLAGMMGEYSAAQLEERLVRFEEQTHHQIAVLTIPTLNGDSLEDFSIRVAEAWKIGHKGADDGAILIIARDDRKIRIEQAVVAAEKKTSGEIVPMIVGASARYAEAELSGVVAGLILGTAVELIWHDPWGSVHAYILWPAAGAVLGYLLGQLPLIKRHILPGHRIFESVHLRSLAAFASRGLYRTKDHTGILIFASLLERRVVVLADRGIDEKVSTGTWQEVVQILTDGLKSRHACDGFCRAIERCGEILSQHFPRPVDDQDELPNKLITETE